MKKTLVKLLLPTAVLAQQMPMQAPPQMEQAPSRMEASQDIKLRNVLSEEDKRLLEERKKQEYYETQRRTEEIKVQTETLKRQSRITQKKLRRTEKVEDIREKELKEAYRMYKYEVPVKGIVGRTAITDGLVLTEDSYVGTGRVSRISVGGIMVENKPMRIHNVKTNELRERALATGGTETVNVGAGMGALPPLPPPPGMGGAGPMPPSGMGRPPTLP